MEISRDYEELFREKLPSINSCPLVENRLLQKVLSIGSIAS